VTNASPWLLLRIALPESCARLPYQNQFPIHRAEWFIMTRSTAAVVLSLAVLGGAATSSHF
jgi:hypothetical protein